MLEQNNRVENEKKMGEKEERGRNRRGKMKDEKKVETPWLFHMASNGKDFAEPHSYPVIETTGCWRECG